MGASGWFYFVPYQKDIRKALQKLREDVFRRGEYESSFVQPPEDVDMMDILDAWQRSWRGDQSGLREILNKRPDRPAPTPETIEQLLDQCAENGTHSILDMQDVSGEPAFCTVSPLDEEDLTQIFGTIWPTHEMAEAKLDELMDLSDRWVGTYLILYKDRQPDEILFTGASGD